MKILNDIACKLNGIGLRFNSIEKNGMQIGEGIENVLMNIMVQKKNF
jgi:hypothetical protein